MTKDRISVGVLVGSNRPLRAGRDMADAVAQLIAERDDVDVTMLDMREIKLPWLDEPKPPSAGDYQHAHTIKWAQTIASLDAIVVVTSQYNGGYPAPLKNAIDSIYAEWKDKPVLLVSYGSHRSNGGQSAAKQLQVVFGVVRANLLETTVSMPLGREDYEQPNAVLKNAPAVIDRHRAELTDAIAALMATARLS